MNVRFHRLILRARSGSRCSRSRSRASTPAIEALEIRQLLSTVNWINTSSGSWDVAANWSTSTVPGPSDDAVIDVSGVTVSIDSGNQSVKSLTADDPLSITGGSLTVASNSMIGGGLEMTGGALTANGAGTLVTVTGTTTVATASLYAEGGAKLSLPDLTSYAGGGRLHHVHSAGIRRAGSVLSFPALTSITGSTAFDRFGADRSGFRWRHRVSQRLYSTSQGPSCCQAAAARRHGSACLAFSARTPAEPSTTPEAPSLCLPLADASGTTIQIGSGVTMTLAKLSKADVASFQRQWRLSSLTLPELGSYAGGGDFITSTLQASGEGSVLSFPAAATSITGSTAFDASVQESVRLPVATSSFPPLYPRHRARRAVKQQRQRHARSVPSLSSYTGGTINDSRRHPRSAFSCRRKRDNHPESARGVTMTLAKLSKADVASFSVEWRLSSLTLPELGSYAGGGDFITSTLQASGAGSVLSFPALTSITGSTAFDASVQIGPASGGDIEFPALTHVTGPVVLSSSNGSGTLSVPSLSSYTGGTINDSGGTLALPSLADASGTTIQIGSGVTMTLAKLSKADVASFNVSGASSLTLPELGSYAGGGDFITSTLQASGAGSVLSFPALTSITGSTAFDASVQVGPSSGGDVELPALIQVTGPVAVSSDGPGSVLSLSLADKKAGTVTVSNNGTAEFGDTAVTTPVAGENVTVDLPQMPQGWTVNLASSGTFSGSTTFNVAQGDSVAVTSGTYTGNTVFNLAQGATVSLAGGTYAGAVVLNVAQGATVGLTGGQTVTYSGTLTGSGAGMVSLNSGILAIAIGGATLNFPGSMFQWTGGSINGRWRNTDQQRHDQFVRSQREDGLPRWYPRQLRNDHTDRRWQLGSSQRQPGADRPDR